MKPRQRSETLIWIAILAGGSISLSAVFACATPFAAIATLAAATMRRTHAFATIMLAWIINQAVGYLALGYPRGLNSFAWGLAIGLSASLAVLAAQVSGVTQPIGYRIAQPLLAAFVAYELALFATSCVLPGGEAGFTPQVVAYVFAVNAVGLLMLIVARALLNVAVRPIRDVVTPVRS